MFKLTREEQQIVAFVLLAIVLGMFVREWRARHPARVATMEIKGR